MVAVARQLSLSTRRCAYRGRISDVCHFGYRTSAAHMRGLANAAARLET